MPDEKPTFKLPDSEEVRRFAAQSPDYDEHGRFKLPPKPQPIKGRLTVVKHIYHEVGGETVTDTPHNYERILQSDDDKTSKRITVGQDWCYLPEGWVTRLSKILVINKETVSLSLSGEEREKEWEAKTVQIGFRNDNEAEDRIRTQWSPPRRPVSPRINVPPGESVDFCPADRLDNVVFRCVEGEAKIIVTVFPF